MATLTALPFTPSKFDVQVVLPFGADWARRVDNEVEAVELAREQVGPNQTQVTIEVGTYQDFAVRHFTWKHGTVNDSGWRCWVGRKFVGGIAP